MLAPPVQIGCTCTTVYQAFFFPAVRAWRTGSSPGGRVSCSLCALRNHYGDRTPRFLGPMTSAPAEANSPGKQKRVLQPQMKLFVLLLDTLTPCRPQTSLERHRLPTGSRIFRPTSGTQRKSSSARARRAQKSQHGKAGGSSQEQARCAKEW